MYAAFALEESRQKRAETGQQEIIGKIKSDILRYNGNKDRTGEKKFSVTFMCVFSHILYFFMDSFRSTR